MNEYKITYVAGEGSTSTSYVVERTEAAATKSLKATFKKEGVTALDILDVELVNANACATKAQEREILAKILTMVAELGPQSYLATAFEGCFEDAESNIENDFGDSYKRRCESLEQKLGEVKAEAEAKVAALEAELLRTKRGVEELIQKNDERKAAIERMQSQALAPDDLADVIQLVSEKRLALDAEVKSAAERIVEAAAEPESAAFQNAVKEHRAAKSGLEYYTAMVERLVKLRS